ncbi:MAG: hypothetical protein ACREVT_01235 [Burkholderiales bacterium]
MNPGSEKAAGRLIAALGLRSAQNEIEQFKAAMRAAGLEPPGVIEPGNLHRFSTNGKASDDAGWCKLFADLCGGVFGDHRSGLSKHWQAKTGRVMTASEREAFQRMVAESKHQAELEERKRHEAAALKAAAILEAATGDPETHPYAVKKRVPLGSLVKRGPWPQRGWDDALLVPIYGAAVTRTPTGPTFSARSPSTNLTAVGRRHRRTDAMPARLSGCCGYRDVEGAVGQPDRHPPQAV